MHRAFFLKHEQKTEASMRGGTATPRSASRPCSSSGTCPLCQWPSAQALVAIRARALRASFSGCHGALTEPESPQGQSFRRTPWHPRQGFVFLASEESFFFFFIFFVCVIFYIINMYGFQKNFCTNTVNSMFHSFKKTSPTV